MEQVWRCIIPAEAIYEPKHFEDHKPERWIIMQPGALPMGIAGIYRKWRAPDGKELYTFAMLTINADAHPVMQQFHRPNEEKRMVVILDPGDYGDWLSCPVADAPQFFKPWMGSLEVGPKPLAPRETKSKPLKEVKPPLPDRGDELF